MKSAFISLFEKRPFEKDSLNGLRAISMLIIFIFHFYDGLMTKVPQDFQALHIFLSNLTSAVDLFFVLSGFLIYGVLYRHWEKTKTVDFKDFYIGRSLRIFPAYYALVFITLWIAKMQLKAMSLSTDPAVQASMPLFAQAIDRWIFDALYVSNYVESLHFHTWSLSLEEQFYLVFPLICYLILFRLQKNSRLIFIVALYCSAAVIRYFIYAHNAGDHPYKIFDTLFHRPAHTRFDSIVVGILAFELYKNWNLVPQNHNRTREYFFLIPGLICLGIASFVPYHFSVYYTVFRFNFSNMGYALVMLASIHNFSWIGKFLSLRIFAPLARVSYGMYLWHLVAIFFASIPLKTRTDVVSWGEFTKMLSIGFVYATIFALLSYFLVEYPFLSLKNRLRRD
ncbi:acyltransferase family protein [Leptospira barantonii]|uniref:Acyltransferase 3 domain-containing protein n=1 Tax=Leptospira barantonii TaxID=2023184 RepID=A0ABX4NMF3_9LEPT|nr:acyltransferase [Leptospira barantonii]PJZ56802.1 hypothetical protein CH367_11890 [Leptospira barantonii]